MENGERVARFVTDIRHHPPPSFSTRFPCLVFGSWFGCFSVCLDIFCSVLSCSGLCCSLHVPSCRLVFFSPIIPWLLSRRLYMPPLAVGRLALLCPVLICSLRRTIYSFPVLVFFLSPMAHVPCSRRLFYLLFRAVHMVLWILFFR